MPHTPTGGAAAGTMRTMRKRLSDGSTKSYKYNTIQKEIDVTFKTYDEKLQFEENCKDIRLALGCKTQKDAVLKAVMGFSLGLCTHTCNSTSLAVTITVFCFGTGSWINFAAGFR
jgi:hypothetical protein